MTITLGGFLIFCALTSPLTALVVLTAVGSRRRGNTATTSAVSGTFFPITWAVWYLRDLRDERSAGGDGEDVELST